eukprot:Amastigsp_a4092_22.p2 type:complete len:170 gc:universal Amastigsp_a4092_22:665-156(-)
MRQRRVEQKRLDAGRREPIPLYAKALNVRRDHQCARKLGGAVVANGVVAQIDGLNRNRRRERCGESCGALVADVVRSKLEMADRCARKNCGEIADADVSAFVAADIEQSDLRGRQHGGENTAPTVADTSKRKHERAKPRRRQRLGEQLSALKPNPRARKVKRLVLGALR